MRSCPNCGSAATDEQAFCSGCGAALANEQTTTGPQESHPPNERIGRVVLGATGVLFLGAATAVITYLALATTTTTARISTPQHITATTTTAPTTTRAARAATASSPRPGAKAAAAIASWLARSAAVRPSVQAAIDAVSTCAESPSLGVKALQSSIDTRQAILSSLASFSASGLPNGARLVSQFTQAMQQSLAADRGYQAWMGDLGNSKQGCGSSPAANPNYQRAQVASVQATAAKASFASAWAPVAAQFHEPTYAAAQF